MVSDQRILVRRGAAVACCLAAFVFLATGPARAGVLGSKHDFSAGKIPGSSSITKSGVCGACHIAHGSEPEVIWTQRAHINGSLDQERAYFNQTSSPNYAPGFTILCYDCHDNHSAVDDYPPDSWFTTARRPQDVAFDKDMKLPLPTNQPRNGSAVDGSDGPGYYENIPSRSVPPATSYMSGHFVVSNPGGGSILVGDKLPCSDCHDPHNSGNQAFIRADLAGKSLSGKVASTKMSYDYVESPAGRNDALSREICIACHGTAEQGTYKAVAFNAINPAYGSATIVTPPPGVPEHAYSALLTAIACTTCHPHNGPLVSCTDCHGTNPSEALLGSAIRGQIWPDGSPDPGKQIVYADNEVGAHPRHMEAIAQYLYGQTAAEVVAAGRQITICGFCHPSPGGGGHDTNGTNDTNGGLGNPSPVDRVNVHSNAVSDKFKVFLVGANAYGDDTHNFTNTDYNFTSKTCSNIDCHYEYVTPTYAGTAPNFGWDGADTGGNEPNCRTCHYYRDAASGSGPGATAVWTPSTPQLPDAHQVHVGGIGPPNGVPVSEPAQSQSYPCTYCHPNHSATNNTGHANGDIDLSAAGNPTLSKETPPDAADELMTPGSSAVKYGVGVANTTCAQMYCHGADFGDVTDTDTLTQGTNIAPTWNTYTTGGCGTCHDVSTRTSPLLKVGQTLTEGKHQTHIFDVSYPNTYGPILYSAGMMTYAHDCDACHGIVNAVPAVPSARLCTVCHPGGGMVPGTDLSDRGWASFPSRSHVNGSFVVDFENLNRNFNFIADYPPAGAPASTVAVLGTAPLFAGGTDICNRCHSTANVVGTVGYTLAKQNWNTLSYRLNCFTCHNATDPADSTPVSGGVPAPTKDNTIWTTKGHGLPSGSTYSPSARAGANLVCTDCHASTSAHINGTLGSTDRLATAGNGLCDGCHGTAGTATKVSTHGNRPTATGAFELNCVECHDPHGSTNIFMVNTVNIDGPLIDPTRWYNNAVNTTTLLFQGAAVAFTANTARTDYAGTTANPNPNKICQTCHTTTSVFRYNTATASHQGTGLCSECHKHGDGTVQNAFMPTGCLGCHKPGGIGPNMYGNGTNETVTAPAKPFDNGTWGFNVNGHGANGSAGVKVDIDESESGVNYLNANLECTDCHGTLQSHHNDSNIDGVSTGVHYPNTYHLRTDGAYPFVPASVTNEYDAQVAFDNACYYRCHQTGTPAPELIPVPNYRHNTTSPYDVEFGKHRSYAPGDYLTSDPKWPSGKPDPKWPVDSDITTLAPYRSGKSYATCSTCHNVHGTNVVELPYTTNRMLREPRAAGNILCDMCHH